MHVLDALVGFAVACAAVAALTPLTARLAHAIGLVDEPRERGLSSRPMPLLGGLAILAGIVVASVALLDVDTQLRGVLASAALATLVGAVDDRIELGVTTKLLGQIAAAVVPVTSGVIVTHVTILLLGPLDLGHAGGPLTVVGLVAVMNIVNFSDGIDGLAAGVCAIAGDGRGWPTEIWAPRRAA